MKSQSGISLKKFGKFVFRNVTEIETKIRFGIQPKEDVSTVILLSLRRAMVLTKLSDSMSHYKQTTVHIESHDTPVP